MPNNRNHKAAIIALIAVVILSIIALFLALRLLKSADFSIKPYPLPGSESASPTPQPTFDLTPPSTPFPSSIPDPLLVFDSVFFGTYMDHPIEWIILDGQDDRLLLLSKRALETLPYHNNDEPVTWESCSLRSWLNGEFLDSAFTSEEVVRIIPTEVDNSGVNPDYRYTDGSAATKDKVFLLSHDEAARLLPEEDLRLCEKSLHAPSYDNVISSWWLRSPGLYPNCAEYVYRTGAFFSGMANRMFVDVRPAIWITTSIGNQ